MFRWLSGSAEAYGFLYVYSRGFNYQQKLNLVDVKLKWVKDKVLDVVIADTSKKWIVGVFHEFLHLIIQKKTERKNVSNLRKPLDLPQKFTKVFERHPGIFYISKKSNTQSVVLKEAYDRQQLIQKHPLVDIRARYSNMMQQGFLDRSRGFYKRSVSAGLEVGLKSICTDDLSDLWGFCKLDCSEKTAKDKFEEFITRVKNCGANVIVTDTDVEEHALQFCEILRLMVLKLSFKAEIRRLCRIIGDVAMVVIVKMETPMCTIVLALVEECNPDELRRAIMAYTNLYKALCVDPEIVLGASATEFLLTTKLMETSDIVTGIRRSLVNVTRVTVHDAIDGVGLDIWDRANAILLLVDWAEIQQQLKDMNLWENVVLHMHRPPMLFDGCMANIVDYNQLRVLGCQVFVYGTPED
ncbi:hypothetical protein RHMOL_Rhmol07G0283900 [Rhododendron molle]|uniref:Uncharacterized protein n=1 Tax=Rhododendron molle TaxID=49168 RepID=A0ACC0N5I0_RHOML|nr:hypothetical protein RHMOL_Rhmol07G0283900 [Rhododendron molle]